MASYELNLELCRICLHVGAEIPLFEKLDPSGETLKHKLLIYINQKIEDLEGFPRHICSKCKTFIDQICHFITTLQDTNNTLLRGLQNIKQEQEPLSDNENCDENLLNEVMLRKNDAKTNVITDSNKDRIYLRENFSAFFNQKDLVIRKIKVEPENGKKKKPQPRKKAKNKSSKIASSVTGSTDSKCSAKSSITKNKQKPKKDDNKKTENIKNKEKKNEAEKVITSVTETNNTVRLRICEVCGKTLKYWETFKSHSQKHEAMANVVCTICGKTCKYTYIKRHMRDLHRPKKYMCAKCGSGFTLYSHLKTHIRIVHEKHLHPPRLYQCTYCSKAYKSKSGALIHENSVHTGLRPAVCSVCDASFFHEVYLKQHMRLHTGETPFKCPVCNRGYAQRGNMISHMHHNHRLSQLTEEQLKMIKPSLLKVLKP